MAKKIFTVDPVRSPSSVQPDVRMAFDTIRKNFESVPDQQPALGGMVPRTWPGVVFLAGGGLPDEFYGLWHCEGSWNGKPYYLRVREGVAFWYLYWHGGPGGYYWIINQYTMTKYPDQLSLPTNCFYFWTDSADALATDGVYTGKGTYDGKSASVYWLDADFRLRDIETKLNQIMDALRGANIIAT